MILCLGFVSKQGSKECVWRQHRQALRAHTDGNAFETNPKEQEQRELEEQQWRVWPWNLCPWKEMTKNLSAYLRSAQWGGLRKKGNVDPGASVRSCWVFVMGTVRLVGFTRWASSDPPVSCHTLENTNLLLRREQQPLEEIFLWNTLGKRGKKSLLVPLILENIWSFDAVLKKDKEKLMKSEHVFCSCLFILTNPFIMHTQWLKLLQFEVWPTAKVAQISFSFFMDKRFILL